MLCPAAAATSTQPAGCSQATLLLDAWAADLLAVNWSKQTQLPRHVSGCRYENRCNHSALTVKACAIQNDNCRGL
jgi:hypothetical protein